MIFFIEMEDVMKELHKRSRNPKYKKKYKVTNWKEYEQSLCNRGSLTLWISPTVIKSWKPRSSKKRGRKQRFSDQSTVYNHILHHSRDAQIIIHPRSNAVVSDKGKWTHRDKHVQKILDEGVHKWRRESGYYQQSKVENTFYRYKTILGKKLRARTEDSREVETILGCQILNRFLELGRCELKLVA